jgi:hypothetical protein
MSSELSPFDGQPFLANRESLARIIDAFLVVVVDRREGRKQVEQAIAQLLRMEAPEEEVEAYRAVVDRTPIVSITDDAESETCYLRFMLIPDRPLLIGYHSATHQRDSDLLLGRLASVLGYRVKLV